MQTLILASGYVSYPDLPLVSKKMPEKIFDKYVIFKNHRNPNNPFYYNNEIDELYQLLSKTGAEINSVDNRASVLRIAKEMFARKNIMVWVDMQTNGPFFSSTLFSFLEDTLKAVLEGKKRRMHVTQWIRLIYPNFTEENRNSSLKDKMVALSRKYDEDKTIPKNLDDQILMWINRPNGANDLLVTLFILFGPRDWVLDVRDQDMVSGVNAVGMNSF